MSTTATDGQLGETPNASGTTSAAPLRRLPVVGPLGPGTGGAMGHGAHGALPGHVTGATPVEPGEDTVTLSIDGRSVTVKKGTNVLMAARGVGVDVPYFCYHPGLSVAAACRQCLVEITGQPKLAPSCQVTCADKMEVKTQSDKAVLARQQQLEFTLVNHPVDCPICDKAGECTLQRLYFDHDQSKSRVDVEKVHKPKAVDLGPTVVLDAERCILCSRCVRVCNEVAKAPQLTFAMRGNREQLTTAPGETLDNPYSLNVVDVCPVGALTSKDFRFSMRAWELSATDSVCPGCATGCSVEVHHAKERLYRIVPRENGAINKYWMCDEGRDEYKDAHAARLASPLVLGAPSNWEKALEEAAKRLSSHLKVPGRVGVVLSARATNEENYLLATLAERWGVTKLYLAGRAPVAGRADGILRVDDINPNRRGAQIVSRNKAAAEDALVRDLKGGALSALIVLDQEWSLPNDAAAAFGKLEAAIALASHRRGAAEHAQVVLPVASWAESSGTYTNQTGITQRIHPSLPLPGESKLRCDALSALARATGMDAPQTTLKQIFLAMIEATPEFAGVTYTRDQLPRSLRFAGSRG